MDLYTLPNESHPDNVTLDMLQNKLILVALPVVYSFVTLISIPGNAISLWILIFHSKPITSSIILMINLSITDLALAVVLPFQIYYHAKGNNWIFGKELCNVVTIMFYVNMYGTILTIMLISLERYLGIIHPMKSSTWRRKRYAIGAILLIYLLLFIVLIPMESTDLTYEVKHLNITTCFDVLKWNMLPNIISWAIFIISLFFLLFLIPSIITVVCYVRIIRKLIQTSNRNGTGHERRSINLAIFVLIVFVTCFAPNNVILLVHTIVRLFYQNSYYYAYKLTLTLSCLSSCVDPFLYYFACKEFRKKALELLNCRSRSIEKSGTRRGSLFSALTFSSGQCEALENGNIHRFDNNQQASDM
ncbi:P2Y purinoceptor 8 [Bufo bufo]|uniref:P2Y purinoceptor 8 n=1 Tax=Bufo bufo TaxID=8384 RepID=UPI001ABE8DBD|nr:P2Y purinoceptor 8 [Bufo bufo]XP_040279657.1 P2Y purinoceptor 8 [Bufo bufo]XP_040279658.1 P2Y purinoceptor 8 [Bufo bufo]XP_040279660.1 P2Y purinoceptor 8 [Bufo bufo]XP_040279661.1 P2Y purinoceptor 8 [Bufo bufo]